MTFSLFPILLTAFLIQVLFRNQLTIRITITIESQHFIYY